MKHRETNPEHTDKTAEELLAALEAAVAERGDVFGSREGL